MKLEHVTVKILRYRPEQDTHPVWQTYPVPYQAEMSILDALHFIKDQLDGTLSYRWSCRMAICGSCGMMVNGVPKLGCQTFLRDYAGGEVRLEPLAHFPIERDLISDISDFVEKLTAIKPYILRQAQQRPEDGTHRQTPAQLAQYHQFSLCINCGLCYAACPQYGLNHEFMGPGALTLLHRYNLDSRDQGRSQRLPVLNSEQGVWSCTFVGYCSTVCPKGVDPAAAIQQGKIVSLYDFFLSKVIPGRS